MWKQFLRGCTLNRFSTLQENSILGPYDDEETRSFYASLPDLKALVPAILFSKAQEADAKEDKAAKEESQEKDSKEDGSSAGKDTEAGDGERNENSVDEEMLESDNQQEDGEAADRGVASPTLSLMKYRFYNLQARKATPLPPAPQDPFTHIGPVLFPLTFSCSIQTHDHCSLFLLILCCMYKMYAFQSTTFAILPSFPLAYKHIRR